jgi:TIR domain
MSRNIVKGSFVCYAHNDKVWIDRLRPHLEPLVGPHGLDVFIDTQIEPGTKWRRQIDDALESATIAIVFVSAEFLNSPFIQEVELPKLLQRVHDVRPYEDGLQILYLLVSAVSDWQMQRSGLSEFEAVIGPKEPPLSKLRGPNQQVVFAKVADRLAKRLPGK